MTGFFDFNSADDQGVEDVSPNRGPTVTELKSQLIDRLPQLLSEFYPEGKIIQHNFVVGDLDGTPGKSLVIALHGAKAGLWTDFATSEGGDVLDVWAHVHGLDVKSEFPAIIDGVANWLGGSVSMPSAPVKINTAHVDDLGKYANKWDYLDKDGKLIACVYRYDLGNGDKEFRPLDVKSGRWQAPSPRPLYNQPGIALSDYVVLVEGEKCADALIRNNICATTAMNGANAPVAKTDWSPLKNKHITVWPDNDLAGKTYAEKAMRAAIDAGANSVRFVSVPAEKPEKWDAADAVAAGEDINHCLSKTVLEFEAKNVSTPAIVVSDWLACARFIGEPKPREWLIEGIFPMAQVSLLAASGGVGKSFLLAQLAREIAAFNGFHPTAPKLFGGALKAKGSAVYFTAEDDFIEMHIRLNSLGTIPDNLYVIPLPDLGGARPLFAPDPNRRMPATTEFWQTLTQQLIDLPDLRAIIFDPLQPLCALDFNVPENAQFVCSQLASLAADTGASVIVAHHFAKREAATPEQAREAIRGSGGLVDGVRCAYALWLPPLDRAQGICKQLDQGFTRNCVVMGGVVKANGRANLNVTVYVRDDTSGILKDRTSDLASNRSSEHMLIPQLVNAIATAAVEGKPYTKTGQNGIYERRFELPDELNEMGKHKLVGLVEMLQKEEKLVAAMARGSTSVKWLDVPDGPVADGSAKFVPGHINAAMGHRNRSFKEKYS